MAQRNSGYARIDGDTYVTPKWVFDALLKVEEFPGGWWDCAPVDAEFDFLRVLDTTDQPNIVTNPPFSLAEKFCRHARYLTNKNMGKVAMLLPHSFDTAKGRVDLWGPPFKVKYVITDRIRWENLEQKKNGPSTNHAWYVWDWGYSDVPHIGWIRRGG